MRLEASDMFIPLQSYKVKSSKPTKYEEPLLEPKIVFDMLKDRISWINEYIVKNSKTFTKKQKNQW